MPTWEADRESIIFILRDALKGHEGLTFKNWVVMKKEIIELSHEPKPGYDKGLLRCNYDRYNISCYSIYYGVTELLVGSRCLTHPTCNKCMIRCRVD
jgi:hypothetical protein